MSVRRAARGRPGLERHPGNGPGIPAPLLSRAHPLWSDPEAARELFAAYLPDDDAGHIADRRLFHTVTQRWAFAHGYASRHDPHAIDWPRWQAALDAEHQRAGEQG
ncbi:hypothetical protein H5397_12745 [Propioniciclava sp. MC1683]|uniref:hypothetical protein n=1 Tax=Propioniciclava sp. MC1683 TaxID=2760309 RepID=UPI0015FF0EFB|nr:hypothetical protein [Propioniciclava sp. MC1683]MBB1502281.1 hypothetical protein [Propioniciclava sp. MC1683]